MLCRASITNMRAVKRFMAHGRVEDTRVAFRQEGPAMWQEARTLHQPPCRTCPGLVTEGVG